MNNYNLRYKLKNANKIKNITTATHVARVTFITRQNRINKYLGKALLPMNLEGRDL